MIRRALLYLRRKYNRSILLFLLLFVLSFALLIGLSVWNSISSVTRAVQQELGTSVIFRVPSYITNDAAYYEDVTDSFGNSQKSYVGPKLNNDTIHQILAQVPNIKDYNAELDHYVHVDDAKLIPGLFDYTETEFLASETMVYGITTTELYSKFRSGAFELVEGRHITADDQFKVLISEEFAEINQLKIGDHVTVSVRDGMIGGADQYRLWGDPKALEIVGIFHVNGYQPTGQWVNESKNTYNWLLTDIATADYFNTLDDKVLYGGRTHEVFYRNVTFFVDDPTLLDQTIDQISSLDFIDTALYEISLDDTMYQSTVDPLQSMRNMVAGTVLVIAVGCFVVLCVVFTMWVKSRRREIAIYLSLGLRKITILGQFVMEAAIVALAALVIATAACQQVPDMLGNWLLASVVEDAQPEVREYTQEEIGQAAMTGTTGELFKYESSTYAGPEHIDFTIGLAEILILAVVELLTIIAAICKGGSFIFALQPRQILTTLS